MHRRSHLNERQLALLRLVAGGDDLAAADNGTKVSATALHHRGLLLVRRSPWRAAITDAGRFCLEHGRDPDKSETSAHTSVDRPARPRPSTSGTARTEPPSTASPDQPTRKRPPPHTTARISTERRAAAVELVDELVAAGEKTIPRSDDTAHTHWRQVVDFAKRNQLIPDGQRIEKTQTRWGELRIRLLNGSHPNSRRDRALPVVPMPPELRGLHPVVKAIQDDSGRLRMGGSLRHRCLLYLHGLTQEAVRRCPIRPCQRGWFGRSR